MRKILVALCLMTIPFAAIANKVDTTKRVVADKVVAVVGHNIILLSDVERVANQIAEIRRQEGTLNKRTEQEEAFEMLLTNKLFATCAVMDSLDHDLMPVDDEVERAMTMMVEQTGGVKALERLLGKPIYQIRADITLDKKQQQLAQIMERHIKEKVKIEFAEVKEFFDTIPSNKSKAIPQQYSYSQIVKLPPQTDERKYAIREQLLGYRQRILSGEVSLGVLAQLYSADRESARRRGEMGPTPTAYLDGNFVAAMEGLKPGEVSQIVESEFGFHLIELISMKEEGGYEMAHFRHILLKPEFTVEEGRNVTAQLDSLAGAINQGKLSFGEAALKFSDDDESKQNGGKVFNTYAYKNITGDIRSTSSRFMAEEMQDRPVDFRQLSALEEGEISAPFETTDQRGNIVYKIIRLDAIYPAHAANVNDDYELIVSEAETSKQNQYVDEWIDENIDRVYVEIDPAFWNLNFQKKGWIEAAKKTRNKKNLDIEFPTREDIDAAIEQKIKRDEEREKAAIENAVKEFEEKEAKNKK